MGAFEILDTQDEPLPARVERHAYDRLIMLSDGVFAIAITLAALDVRAPAHWDGDPASLLTSIHPALTAYAIAFIVISAYWMAHRRLIALFRRVDGPASVLSLAMLALVALQPAAIRLLTEYNATKGAGRIYFAQLVLLGLVQATLWVYAWVRGGMIDSSVQTPARWFVLISMLAIPLVSAGLGIGIGRSSGLVPYLLIGLLVLISQGRRATARRLGL